MRITLLLLAAVMTTLAGCAVGPTPQNPQEFRESVKKGSYGTLEESYEVNNSYAKTSAILKAKGSECFNKTITTQECRGTSCFNRQYILIPRFASKGKSAELTVQTKTNHGNVKDVYLGGPPPESGAYMAVADVVDLGNGKTKVSVYGTKITMFAHIPKAIKHWTNGTNLGCPDFTADL